MRIDIHHYLHVDAEVITGLLAQMEQRLMATLDEAIEIANANAAAAASANAKLDSVVSELQALRAEVAGNAGAQAKIDELVATLNATKADLDGVTADVTATES